MFGESPNFVKYSVIIMSQILAKLNVVISFSPNLVKFSSNSTNMVKIPMFTNKISSFFPPNSVIFGGCTICDFFGENIFTKYVKTGVIHFNC